MRIHVCRTSAYSSTPNGCNPSRTCPNLSLPRRDYHRLILISLASFKLCSGTRYSRLNPFMILLLPPPSVGLNVRFVTDDPIKPNRNPIKLDGISMGIQAPTSTQYMCVCIKFKVQNGDPQQSVTLSIFSTSPLHCFLQGKKHGTCKWIQLECACKNLKKLAQNCGRNQMLDPTEGRGNDSIHVLTMHIFTAR